MTTVLVDSYNTGDDTSAQASTVYWLGQSFQASDSYSCEYAKLKLWKNPAVDPGTLTLVLKAATGNPALPTGSILASGTTDGDTLPSVEGSAEWRTITFSSAVDLTEDSSYAVYLYPENAGSYPIKWREDRSSPAYDGTQFCRIYSNSVPPGNTWTAYTGGDLMFELWGTVTFEPPAGGSNQTYVKRMVAAAANKVWYEDV